MEVRSDEDIAREIVESCHQIADNGGLEFEYWDLDQKIAAALVEQRELCAKYAEKLAEGVGNAHEAADGMRCVAQSIREHYHANLRYWGWSA